MFFGKLITLKQFIANKILSNFADLKKKKKQKKIAKFLFSYLSYKLRTI